MIEDSFGHWFAGFSAGEGCFDIRTDHGRYQCRFSINLRADDVAILQLIQKEFGGRIHRCKNRDLAPNCKLEIDSKEGCLKLCDLFTKYPLRAKKADDFKVWKKAVHEWTKTKVANKWQPDINQIHWKQIGVFKEQLNEARTYKELA